MRALLAAALVTTAACSARADNPSFQSLQRDVTVAVFWATWCPPCREELPKLEALQKKYGADAHVRVVAVSVDHANRASAARKLVANAGLTMPLITDGEALYFKIFGPGDTDVPRIAVVDRALGGLDLLGSDGASAEELVRKVSAAVEAMRAGTATSTSAAGGWQPLTHAARR
jgi:thiol-disulfide isomerase/thioredoxin